MINFADIGVGKLNTAEDLDLSNLKTHDVETISKACEIPPLSNEGKENIRN